MLSHVKDLKDRGNVKYRGGDYGSAYDFYVSAAVAAQVCYGVMTPGDEPVYLELMLDIGSNTLQAGLKTQRVTHRHILLAFKLAWASDRYRDKSVKCIGRCAKALHTLDPLDATLFLSYVDIWIPESRALRDLKSQLAIQHPLTREIRSATEAEAGKACHICLEDVQAGQELASLICSHIFHTACIFNWLYRPGRKCPVCGEYTRPSRNG